MPPERRANPGKSRWPVLARHRIAGRSRIAVGHGTGFKHRGRRRDLECPGRPGSRVPTAPSARPRRRSRDRTPKDAENHGPPNGRGAGIPTAPCSCASRMTVSQAIAMSPRWAGAAGSPAGGAGNDSTLVGSSRPRQRALSAAMTASSHNSTETSAAGSAVPSTAAACAMARRTVASAPGCASHCGDSVRTSTVRPCGVVGTEAAFILARLPFRRSFRRPCRPSCRLSGCRRADHRRRRSSPRDHGGSRLCG